MPFLPEGRSTKHEVYFPGVDNTPCLLHSSIYINFYIKLRLEKYMKLESHQQNLFCCISFSVLQLYLNEFYVDHAI